MKNNSEKYLERKLVEAVKAVGGMCVKIHNPYYRGLPDRLVILPDGGIVWVELKTLGKKLTKLQQLAHEELRKREQLVYVIDSEKKLNEFSRLIGYGI
jgi:hypothetical protein